jgi:hypothetical protein
MFQKIGNSQSETVASTSTLQAATLRAKLSLFAIEATAPSQFLLKPVP